MPRILPRAALFLAALLAASAAAHAGTAIVIGGALKLDNDAVWQRIVDEAGGAGARFAVIPTAAADPERSAAQIVAALNRHGARAEAIPVSPRLQTDAQNDPAWIARVSQARGIYFAGGAQELIVDTLQPGGEASPMLKAIREVFDRGGVVAGSSAGAAVMSRMMFRDAQDSLQILKGRWQQGREYDRGLGFVGPDLFVDQHFLRRGRIGRMLPAMRAFGYRLGLGVEENSAIVIKGPQVEVIGARGVLFVDLSDASTDAKQPLYNVRGAELSYLERGDRVDLATRRITPSGEKRSGSRIDPAAPGFKPYLPAVPSYMDILGESTIATAMVQLLDGPQPQVIGMAWRSIPAPDDPAPDIGFEFRLYRGEGFVGWFSSAQGGEDYTVLHARLDVRPVRLNTPLYRPLE